MNTAGYPHGGADDRAVSQYPQSTMGEIRGMGGPQVDKVGVRLPHVIRTCSSHHNAVYVRYVVIPQSGVSPDLVDMSRDLQLLCNRDSYKHV